MRLDQPSAHIYNPCVSSTSGLQPNKSSTAAQEGLPQAWASQLRRLRLANWVAALLETNAGLGMLGAQALHLGAPLVNGFLDEDRLRLAADTLEDPRRLQGFIDQLREGQP